MKFGCRVYKKLINYVFGFFAINPILISLLQIFKKNNHLKIKFSLKHWVLSKKEKEKKDKDQVLERKIVFLILFLIF